MPINRKPIAFDTTLRNPGRIPDFIELFCEYENQVLTSEIILNIEAKIIQQKIFKPTQKTLGTYVRAYDEKFHFLAEDQSREASDRVINIFNHWQETEPGTVPLDQIVYLLKNTITDHSDHWEGGWESRLWTQCKFLNELGLVYMEKIFLLEFLMSLN